MPVWIHPDFLESEAAYARSQAEWTNVFVKVLRTTSMEVPWNYPWMNNPTLDGNPIFTAVCQEQSRGIRIIQEPPGEPDDFDLDWWIDYVGDRAEPDAIRELVVACCPSSENMAEVKDLLRQWISTGKINQRGAWVGREAETSGRGRLTPALAMVG